jgi:hypothetical protein
VLNLAHLVFPQVIPVGSLVKVKRREHTQRGQERMYNEPADMWQVQQSFSPMYLGLHRCLYRLASAGHLLSFPSIVLRLLK